MKKAFIGISAVALSSMFFSFTENRKVFEITNPALTKAAAYIEPDSVFLIETASSNKMEILLGEMAQKKGRAPQVKNFGAMMVRDHTAANNELMAIAAKLNITIPDTLLVKHKVHVDHLSTLNGRAFDKAYVRMMMDAHKDDIDEFEDASKKAADADVRTFAAKQLQVLLLHQQSVSAMRTMLKD